MKAVRIFFLFLLSYVALSGAAFSAQNDTEVIASYKEKIANGSAKATYQLARHYVKQERFIEAEEWLKHAAFLGYAPAAIELAAHYEAEEMAIGSSAVTPERIKHYGFALLEYGDKMNDPESLFALGEYYRAKNEEAQQKRGDDYMHRAAKVGHKEAMLEMAEAAFACCDNPATAGAANVPHAQAEGLYWLRRAAKKGSGKAWLMLGEYYMGTMGDVVDEAKARAAFEQAASLGQPTAIRTLAEQKASEE